MDKNLKKFLQCFGVVLVVIVVLQLSGKEIPILGSFIDSMGATDNSFVYEIKDKAVYIKGYSGNSKKIEIPEELDGMPVKVISNGAFSELSNLEEVIIPSTVSDIEEKAFSCCTSLVQVNVPDTVTKIGDEAFFNCTSLENVNLPSTLNSIGVSAFSSTAIKEIKIPDTVTSIGTYAFANCYALKSIDLPGSIGKIEDNTFYCCTDLTEVTIPGSVSKIGNMAFSSCKSLKKVTIPSSVNGIEQYAFEDCVSLEQIDMPDTIEHVGSYAFSGCSSLKNVHISENISVLEEGCFTECKDLESIDIPKRVEEIGKNAFSLCISLKELEIPANVVKIDDNAFLACKGLEKITIDSGVKTIGNTAFMECKSLTNVTIGNSIDTIGELAFYKCSYLNKVLFLGDVPNKISDGAFEMIDEQGMIIVPEGKLNDFTKVLQINKNLTYGAVIVEGSSFEAISTNTMANEKNSITGDANKDESSQENSFTTQKSEETQKPEETKQPEENTEKENTVIEADDNKYNDLGSDIKDENTTCKVRYLNEDGSLISSEDVTYNSSVTLSQEPAQTNGIFIGWAAKIGNKKVLCMENSEYVVDENMDFEAVWVDLYILSGASIRLSNPTGIRFSSRIDTNDYTTLRNYADKVEFGTVICPKSYLDEVTIFSTKKLSEAGKKFLDIPVNVWYAQNADYKEFTGVMTNVKEVNYAKIFSARSYVNVTYWDGTECKFYSAFSKDDNSRSICGVANSAIKDSTYYSNEQIDMLKNFINVSNMTGLN